MEQQDFLQPFCLFHTLFSLLDDGTRSSRLHAKAIQSFCQQWPQPLPQHIHRVSNITPRGISKLSQVSFTWTNSAMIPCWTKLLQRWWEHCSDRTDHAELAAWTVRLFLTMSLQWFLAELCCHKDGGNIVQIEQTMWNWRHEQSSYFLPCPPTPEYSCTQH